jgi:nucleoside-diphosphate-sugar epimerase
MRVRLAVRRAAPALHPGEEVVPVGDIGPDTDWSEALAGAQVVVHAAAQTAPIGRVGDRELADLLRRVNTEGTRRLAEAAVRAGVGRFIFLSSAKAVGESTPHNMPWDDAVSPRPVDAYGRTKLEAETALAALARDSEMQTVVLRSPIVYGPGVTGNFLRLLDLCDSALPVPLGSIRNRRSMIYVDNLASAIAAAIDSHEEGCFLIDDGESLSTSDLVRRLRQLLGRRPRIFPVPLGVLERLGTLLRREEIVKRLTGSLELDSQRFRHTFGWSPPSSVDEGLAATVAWYRARAAPGERQQEKI